MLINFYLLIYSVVPVFDDIIAAARENSSVKVQEKPVQEMQREVPKSDHAKDHGENEHDDSSQIRITVIGVGGAGCNSVNRLMEKGIKSARTIAINTDGKHLKVVNAHKKILLGKTITRGLGAGGYPEVARKCAEADRAMLKTEIGECELVFVCAGMGGGTGGGAASVIAQIAKEQGAIVVSIVTYPFKHERVRLKKAQQSITELSKTCDTVVVIDNNRLSTFAPNLQIDKAFEFADSVTSRAVTGISDTIMFPSLMNIDFADVRSIMQGGGISLISMGEASGVERVDAVVKDTLEHPLLDVSYEGAKGCLIHVEGGSDLTLGDVIKIGERLTNNFDPDANVKVGARIDLSSANTIRVTAIITGVKSPYILQNGQEGQDAERELLPPAMTDGGLQFL